MGTGTPAPPNVSHTPGEGGGAVPAPGTPAYNPTWYGYTDIYWDPVGGSDANAGNVIGAPVLTFAEIIRRYGSTSPKMNYGQSVTFHLLSAQPAGQDPIFFEPQLSGGGQAILDCSAAWVAAGVDFACGALSGGFGYAGAVPSAGGTPMVIAAVPGYVVAKVLLFNSARNSYVFVDSVAAGNATVSQPQTLASLTTTTAIPAAVFDNDWVAGDNIKSYSLPTLNLKRWSPKGGDLSAANHPCAGWIIGARIADSSSSGASVYLHHCATANNVLSLCLADTRVHVSSEGGRGFASYLLGCMVGAVAAPAGTLLASPCRVYGGILSGGIQVIANTTGASVLNNTLLHGASDVTGITSFSGFWSDGSITVEGNLSIGGFTNWGSWAMTVNPGGKYVNESGGTWAVNAALTTGVLKLGTATTGSKYQGAGVFVDAVALTPANIDTGGTGGAGLCNPVTGAAYCNAI